jgi:hypothetical protein
MNRIYKNIFLAVILIFTCYSHVHAQSDSTKSRESHFTIYLGVGPNYYFNNLEIEKDNVNELNHAIIGRIMWEPIYNLSLGFESGYNRLYTISKDFKNADGSIDIVNSAIPLSFVIQMKFFENFYANFNVGTTILQNKVTTSHYGDFNASTISLGDFGGGIGYRKPFKKRFFLGAETKFMWSAKLEDRNLSLLFMAGYKL